MLFLPADETRAEAALEVCLEAQGLKVLTWRDVPTRVECLGEIALSTMPKIRQVLIQDVSDKTLGTMERRLYLARKHFERMFEQWETTGYICSLSSKTIVYKSMCAGRLLSEFYPDLASPKYVTPFAIFHQRYATNTLPAWHRAQPGRTLAHNGEINTVWGNRARLAARASTLPADCKPFLSIGGTDSTSLDEVVELISRNGRSIAEAMRMLLPPAVEGHQGSEFLRYHADCVEPWDGPAAIAFSDGRVVGVALDRNGLRPCRFAVTSSGLVVAGSEIGLVDLDPAEVVHSGRLGPGQMLAVDLVEHWLYEDEALLELFDAGATYAKLVEEATLAPVPLRAHARRRHSRRHPARLRLHPRRRSDDPPAHGARGQGRRLLHGRRHPARLPRARPAAHLRLLPPALRPGHQPGHRPPARGLRRLPAHPARPLAAHAGQERPARRPLALLALPLARPGRGAAQAASIPTSTNSPCRSCPASSSPQSTLAEGARRTSARRPSPCSARAPRYCCSPTAPQMPHLLPIPMAMAVGAVHEALVAAGLRTHAGLIAEAGDCRDIHHAAILIGYGAGAVCPWLALETGMSLAPAGTDPAAAEKKMLKSLDAGLAKIMSKMGISVVDSYRSAHLFDILGLHETVVERCFVDTPAPLSGIGFAEIENQIRQTWLHRRGADRRTPRLRLGALPQGRTRRASSLAAAHHQVPPVRRRQRARCASARRPRGRLHHLHPRCRRPRGRRPARPP